ncbi:MAG: adenylate/guanylate cyclase domain-containing protein [Ignavibacteria bacterium]|nr:adenylate/guanylate cyclase domain-containing protein [Ignavibacteria bacterium]
MKSVIVETYTTLADVDRAEGLGDQAISRQREAFARLQSSGDHRKAIAVAVDLVGWLKEEQRYQDALEVQEAIATVQQSINERDLERSLEISTVRERLADERTAVRVRDEERNKVLHAVLPAHIANRLTSGERQIVDTLPAVTILFADVVGFTELVSSMTGEALLDLLSKLFTGMDIAASRFGCERIKTIGDSYMAICGASEAVDDHIERIVRMALCVVNGEVPLPIDPSQLRIGINTGPVIAGVMDGQRIAYDVWGDTVNVAARMEEHSRPGSISCTEAVAQGVRQIPEFNLIKREPLNIHGKGLMTTYWLEKAT